MISVKHLAHSKTSLNGFWYNELTVVMMSKDKLLSVTRKTPEAHPWISQWQEINVGSETGSYNCQHFSRSPTHEIPFNFVTQEDTWRKSLNKMLHPQNRIKRKQKVFKSFEKIRLTIERGNSFRCDAMALEMNRNKLGQQQINLKIIAEKKKELCHAHSAGKSDKKGRVWRVFSPPSSRIIGVTIM